MDMLSDVANTAREAGLSSLVIRVAVILADIDGEERAMRFIKSCQEEDELRALKRLREEFESIRRYIEAQRATRTI